MTRDELLAALVAERYDNRWWTDDRERTEAAIADDSDVTTAKRRRQMAEDFERANRREASA